MHTRLTKSEYMLEEQVLAAADEIRAENRRRERTQAERAAAVGRTRKRAVGGGVVLAVPLLVVLLAVNVLGWSPRTLVTPAPSPAEAQKQARTSLKSVVAEIEAFRTDFAQLPEDLAEVGIPAGGEWSYVRTSTDHYRVNVRIGGQQVTFDSQSRGGL